MSVYSVAAVFPAWVPHFTLIQGHLANELIVLRWLHLVFGVMWIGLLYYFNLVQYPAMREVEAGARAKVYPALMSRAMGWFRWSALVTVIVGIRYFQIHLTADANADGAPGLMGKWMGMWFAVWLVAYLFIYALQLPSKGILGNGWLRAVGIAFVVSVASWVVLVLNGGENVSSPHLAISVGGGIGLVLLLNTWGVVWRIQKKLIRWSRASAEMGEAVPAEADRLKRWNYLTARCSFWLSFPMLFLMGAASHYPFLSTVAK
jgi:uncharacterized membrane protein